MGVPERDPLAQLSLPPGFRFFPTDEELLVQYLLRKVAGHRFDLPIIAEIDLYKFDPWVLPTKALFGEKEWYFFSPRDRKYPNGSRPNRVAGSGYWKATGTDKIITTEGRKVGVKKALVFYIGKAPKGTKTNWIMHEYRLIEHSRRVGSSKLDDWVLCRIYRKNSSSSRNPLSGVSCNEHSNGTTSSSSSHLDDVLESLPEINDQLLSLPRLNSLKIENLESDNFDWATLVGFKSAPELVNSASHQTQAQGAGNFNCQSDEFISSLSYVDSPAEKIGKAAKEEVQSGTQTPQVHNSGLFQQNSDVLSQSYWNPFHASGLGYPIRPNGLGFRR